MARCLIIEARGQIIKLLEHKICEELEPQTSVRALLEKHILQQ
jgi:hypothetical protein